MLTVKLLGQFCVSVDGCLSARQPTDRVQSLLAYLVLHANVCHSRAHLAFVFWPEMSEANGRNNLRQLVHQLRRLLPEPDRYLRSDVNTLLWVSDTSISVDVTCFEAARAEAERANAAGDTLLQRMCLERALNLCEGPLFPSCFDDWIVPLRERQIRQCEVASGALVSMLEEQREYGSAIARVRHWLRHDPFDEEAYRRLMRLLALSGDRAAALQAYRQCVDALHREFEAEPSGATLRVFERIRGSEPTEGKRVAAHRELPPPLSLVGRNVEWTSLRTSWERASEGHASFVCVTGDAGIGKSRLAEELVTWIQRQGAAAAKTRCYAAEGRLSLAPISEWLRSSAIWPHLARLQDVWRIEVARLLPALLGESDLQQPTPLLQFGDRMRFFEGMARAVLAVPAPVVLVIDDLQWCDSETLEWLHFLFRFAPEAPLFVLGTARAEVLAPAHPLPTLLRHLQSASQLFEISLEPLDAAETAALASEIGQRDFDPEAATRLYRETEGNPLFIVETIRADVRGEAMSTLGSEAWGLPPRAHAVISSRLAQLSADARNVLAAAAIIGRGFELEFLVDLVGNEERVSVALDELWRKRVIREQGPSAYDFTHDKLRDVAYGETSVPQRRMLHRRIAEALAAMHERGHQMLNAPIASHYEKAGLLDQAVPHYLRAASEAQALYAHDDAMSLAHRGLSLLRQLPTSKRRDGWELELQLVLAPSYRVTKGWAAPELGEVLDRARALCDQVGTALQRATILYGMQSLYAVAARLEESAMVTDDLVSVLRDAVGKEPPPAAFAMLAGLKILKGEFKEGSEGFEKLVEQGDETQLQHLQESQGLNYEIHSRVWQSHALWCLGLPDTALVRTLNALQLARQLEQPFSQAIAATYLALLQQLRADPETFRVQAEQALELATKYQATYYRTWSAILVAYAGTLERPDASGLDSLRNAIEEFKRTGARLRLPYYLALLAEAHLRANRATAGLAVVEQALNQSRDTNERWWDAELYRLRAELLHACGAEIGETETALRRALQIAREQQAKSLELRAALSLARKWSVLGQVDDARKLLSPLYAGFTEGFGTPDLVGVSTLLESL